MIAFTLDDVRDAVSRNAFAKAREYLRLGNVLATALSADGAVVTSKVQGSARRPYAQDISLSTYPGGLVEIEGTCSCPVGFNCKHVAAALMAVLEGRGIVAAPETLSLRLPDNAEDTTVPRTAALAETKENDASPAAPPDIAAWLRALDEARDGGNEDYPPEVRQRLVYVLSLDAPVQGIPALNVAPMSARLRKDGSYAANASRWSPQNIHQPKPAKFLRPSDRRIMRRLVAGPSYYYGAGGRRLEGAEGVETLRQIIATGRARWKSIEGPAVSEGRAWPGRLAWRLGEDGTQQLAVETESGFEAFRLAPAWYVDAARGVLGPLELDCPQPLADTLLAAPPVTAAAAGLVRAELAKRLPALEAAWPAPMAPPEPLRAPPLPHLELFVGELAANPYGYGRIGSHSSAADRERVRTPLARLAFRYGPVLVLHANKSMVPTVAHEGRLYAVKRDRDGERRAFQRLIARGLRRVADVWYANSAGRHGNDFMLMGSPSGREWIDFHYLEVPKLRSEGWTVAVADDFPVKFATFAGEVTAELHEGSGIDWFELALGTTVDGERVDLVPALLAFLEVATSDDAATWERAAKDAPVFLPLADGRILPLPFGRIRPILKALLELFSAGALGGKATGLGFSALDAGDLAAFEEATRAAGLLWRGGERLRELGRLLRETGSIPRATVPPDFRAALRPYQARGLDWLQFLRKAGIGGILADDMGLGKTVQTLAHLAAEKASGHMDRPSLVVCPTSLVTNWAMEAARFAPALSLLTLHGADRKARFGAIPSHDLAITTYPLLARDHETLAALAWHLVVLDEAQTIKNPNALTTRLVAKLEARQRLCLSGTPLENHLGELWSLFAFLAPGFLGDRQDFNRRYRVPIEKLGDVERRTQLARRVRPFLLRRTKEEVELELPPKTEIVERVEMEAAQRAIYESIRLAMHAKVREAVAAKGLARSSIVILDALLKLRQVCCDPRLVKLQAVRNTKAGSAKLERLMEMIPELVEEGRRILLFSQFTSMLALIEEALDRAGIARVVLTGDTRERGTPIRRFQAGEVPLFLISLKAGGTGLNLTAADTVILYDPWWNPAVEDQASGRAHRIGQNKAVFVHKLVMLETVEEKMEALKARKRDLVASILDAERSATLAITEEDIEALFAPSGRGARPVSASS